MTFMIRAFWEKLSFWVEVAESQLLYENSMFGQRGNYDIRLDGIINGFSIDEKGCGFVRTLDFSVYLILLFHLLV